MGGERTVGFIYPASGHGATRRRTTEYGHPAHRGFARAVGADDLPLPPRRAPGPLADTLLPALRAGLAAGIPARDVYVTENDHALYALPVVARQHPDATVVHLAAADRLLVPVCAGRPDDPGWHSALRCGNNRIETALLRRLLRRHCAGAVAVSSLVRDLVRSFAGPTFPLRVVTPYVQPDAYDALGGVDPALDAPVAVTVGAWRPHKGIDLLVDAWPRVRERHPDAELWIVGPGHPTAYAETPGVSLRGFVASLPETFAAASLYVHPARVEAFGVSVVEAMRAGLPAVVTETTGARTAVEAVDETLVVPPGSADLAAAVADYFDAGSEERRALSSAARAATARYTEAEALPRFERAFDDLTGATGPRASRIRW